MTSIDDIARAAVMDLMHSHEPREAIIARAIRAALTERAGPMADVLRDLAADYGGAAEGSAEEATLARIGAALAAWDDTVPA